MHGLLIAERRNQVDLAYEQLSARAAVLGHEISSRTLAWLANDSPAEYPGQRTLRAVAAAMDLPTADVQQAVVDAIEAPPDKQGTAASTPLSPPKSS